MDESELTVADAIFFYWRGAGRRIDDAMLEVWKDRFRGYEPLILLDAARKCLDSEEGQPKIRALKRAYHDLKENRFGRHAVSKWLHCEVCGIAYHRVDARDHENHEWAYAVVGQGELMTLAKGPREEVFREACRRSKLKARRVEDAPQRKHTMRASEFKGHVENMRGQV